jgi:CRP-like cAMP-binding protein
MNIRDLLLTFKKTTPFGGLTSNSDLRYLARKCELIRHPAGQEILAEGDEVDSIYLILEGKVRVCFNKGLVWSLTLGKGSLFGEMEYVQESTCWATIVTIEPTFLIRVKHRVIKRLVSENPLSGAELYHALLKNLSEKHTLATKSLIEWKLDNSLEDVAHDLRSRIRTLQDLEDDFGSDDSRRLFRGVIDTLKKMAIGLSVQHKNERLYSCTHEKVCTMISDLAERKNIQNRSSSIGVAFIPMSHASDATYSCELENLELYISDVLDNAIQSYNSENRSGAIIVSLISDKNCLRIFVKDDGCGFSPKILKSLGSTPVTHGKTGGKGIGLFRAFRGIEKWGGHMVVCSAVGLGACICIKLPRCSSATPTKFIYRRNLSPIHIVRNYLDDVREEQQSSGFDIYQA